MEFGELKDVTLRDVWGNEAQHFTPCLRRPEFKGGTVAGPATPIVHRLSSIEPGNIEDLAMRIYANGEYFVLPIGILSVALVSSIDLDGYLDWREELIEDLGLQDDADGIRRVSISEVSDLDRIATRIYTDHECFVLEREVLSVAFIHPVDLG